MGITLRQTGDFSKINTWLEKTRERFDLGNLDKYGMMGVKALRDATPVDTGETANSWYYTIGRTNKGKTVTINFCNSHIEKHVPIAIILQMGHATRNGGWVEGIDYINPTIKPVFDDIAQEAWEEVSSVK